MRHRVSLKKLNKTPAHRKAMIKNMLIALYRYEQIKTTHAKSKVLRRFAEKLITTAKVDSVHNRRMVARWIQDKAILNKLFTEIGPKFANRNGGYTRIVKIGARYGDASEMAYLSLVDEELVPKKKTKQVAEKSTSKGADKSKTVVDKPKIAENLADKSEANPQVGARSKQEDAPTVSPVDAEFTAEAEVGDKDEALVVAPDAPPIDESSTETTV